MHDIGIMQGRLLPSQPVLQTFPNENWREEFACARRLGFSYIELLFDSPENLENPLCCLKRSHEIREVAATSQVRTPSICADYFTKLTPQELQTEGTSRLAYLIKYASEISASRIVVPLLGSAAVSSRSELTSFLQAAESQIVTAGAMGVTLCIETHLRADIVVEGLAGATAEVKVCYDLGNAAAAGNDAGDIDLLRKRLALVHIKDRQAGFGPNVPLGEGCVDFVEAFHRLSGVAYRGDFTLETTPGDEPRDFAVRHLGIVKALREILQ